MISKRLMAVLLISGVTTVVARGVAPERLYEQGQFEEARKRFEQAAASQPDNAPLQYNLGAAAYRAGDHEAAAAAFERAAGARDPALQTRALYNLGNAQFRIAETRESQGADQSLPAYEQSMTSYQAALAVQPTDPDAKFNLDVVKRKIEELKKQQQEQQNQQQQQKNDPNQQPDESKSDEQSKPDQPPPQDDQQQDPAPPQTSQSQPNEPQESAEQMEKGESKPEAQNEQEPLENKPAEGQAADQRVDNEPKDPEARQLLDRLREEERMWNYYPELRKEIGGGEPEKDW